MTKPTEPSSQPNMPADGGVQGPMSQQGSVGLHGYDIHPQKFVRLIGCHLSNTPKYEAPRPLRRTAA
jgi:hypothetical protein